MDSFTAVLEIYREIARTQGHMKVSAYPGGPVQIAQPQDSPELFLTLVSKYFPNEIAEDSLGLMLLLHNARIYLLAYGFLILGDGENYIWVDMERPFVGVM